jgi:hypothetical protein
VTGKVRVSKKPGEKEAVGAPGAAAAAADAMGVGSGSVASAPGVGGISGGVGDGGGGGGARGMMPGELLMTPVGPDTSYSPRHG